MIPLTGFIFIPLGLLLVFLPWRYCLTGLVVFSMMSASAVVNIGSFGLQPGYYMVLLLIARGCFELLRSGFTLNSFVLGRLTSLAIFFAVCLVVLFVAVTFFQGKV